MQVVSVADLMVHSGVAFGTSGARGLVEKMNDKVCFAYTCAFLQHLTNIGQFNASTAVAIAGDLRPSTPRILAACAAAIRHMGGKVKFCGYVPSPAVAAYGFAQGSPSLMVTGSHIPDDRNGIKFNRIDGEILKHDELAVRTQNVAIPDIFDAADMLTVANDLPPLTDAKTGYVARFLDFFDTQSLKGLRLGIYEHSAVGRDVLVEIVEALGATAVRLGRSEKFIPVDTEAVRPEDQVLAHQWAAEFNLDAILSTDGDSDRPLLADENGTWLRGDVLGILCAQILQIRSVVTPVSCNSAVELCESFQQVCRTRIGSPFVIEGMNALVADAGTVCGYEANGGFLLATPVELEGCWLSALPTRDAVLPMLSVLAHANKAHLTLSALQEQLPKRFTYSERLQNFPTVESQALIARLQAGTPEDVLMRTSAMFGVLAGTAAAFDVTDGLRITFADGDVIHLRASGNAPELRCYTESSTTARAAALNAQVLDLIGSKQFA